MTSWHGTAHVLIFATAHATAEALALEVRQVNIDFDCRIVTSAASLQQQLSARRWDLLLCCQHELQPSSIEQLIDSFRQHGNGPALLLTQPERLSEALQTGASNLLFADAPGHLCQVLTRELDQLAVRRNHHQQRNLLRQQALQLRRLQRHSTIPVAELHEGRHHNINVAYAELFGVDDPLTLKGQPLADLLSAPDQVRLHELLQQIEQPLAAAHTLQVTALREDDEALPVQLELSPLGPGAVRVFARRARAAAPAAPLEAVASAAETAATAANDDVLALLSEHVRHNTLVLLFQPTVCLRGEEHEHYEVYLRMPSRDGRLMTPDEFMPLAERAGMGGRIDRWVVLHALRRLASHRQQRPSARLTINLTQAAYTDPRFLPWLRLALQAASFPREAVVLQLSELPAARALPSAAAFTRALERLDCLVSLSHFGQSTDAFQTLRQLHADYAKLDGQFVQEHLESEAGRVTLQNMLEQLHQAGYRTIVPMVSDVHLLARLFQAGATYVQGNYFAEPSHEMDYQFYTRVGLT